MWCRSITLPFHASWPGSTDNKKLSVLMWCPAGEKKIVHYFGLDQDKASRTWLWHSDEKNKRVFNLVDGGFNPSSLPLNVVAIFLHLHSGKSHRHWFQHSSWPIGYGLGPLALIISSHPVYYIILKLFHALHGLPTSYLIYLHVSTVSCLSYFRIVMSILDCLVE